MRTLERDVRPATTVTAFIDGNTGVPASYSHPVICTRTAVGQYIVRVPGMRQILSVVVSSFTATVLANAQISGTSCPTYCYVSNTGALADGHFNISITGRF